MLVQCLVLSPQRQSVLGPNLSHCYQKQFGLKRKMLLKRCAQLVQSRSSTEQKLYFDFTQTVTMVFTLNDAILLPVLETLCQQSRD